MEENRISKHYADIADKYDDLYSFTYDYIAEFAVRHMDLEVDDLLADIGAGTGGVTSLIWKKAGLNNPVLCVDPSLDMIKVAEKREGLKTCLATADDFFDGKHQSECVSGIYNKLVFVGSANLLPEPSITFRKAFEYLPSHGLLLLHGSTIYRMHTSTLGIDPEEVLFHYTFSGWLQRSFRRRWI